MRPKKKKGHNAKNSSPLDNPQTPVNVKPSAPTSRRSALRNPRSFSSVTKPELDDGRKERKVKLVVGLPEFDGDKEFKKQKRLHSRNPDSGSDSDDECGDREEAQEEKRKISGSVVDNGSGVAVFKVEDGVKVTDAAPKDGSPLESGPTTLLPDKKLLFFILDKLQKKDTHSVFSEPVDIDELPDYFDVIEQPMDFGTVRKKLDGGDYLNLEQFEVDVFLICSNAMQYNDPGTIFYRQARAIRELAKKEFEILRNEGADDDDDEPQVKVIRRRGRPPSKKNLKNSTDASSPADCANFEDKATGSCGYNLRKAPALNRFRSNDQFVSSYPLRNGENHSDWLNNDWNNEFPASILRADMRYGKKQFTVDETRRDTYWEFRPQSSTNRSPQLLVPVGLHEPLVYARSLARFAANLGSVAWKMASRRIESILPHGVQYGPGWVKEPEATAEPSSFSSQWQRSSNCSAVNSDEPAQEAPVNAFMRNKSVASNEEASPWKTPFPKLQPRNGFTAVSGHNGSYLMIEGASFPSQTAETSYRNRIASGPASSRNLYIQDGNMVSQTGFQASSNGTPEMITSKEGSRLGFSSPPDLSATSSSSQQPELALQL